MNEPYPNVNNQPYPKADLGSMWDYDWVMDPKRLLFSLSRYKFVAKMLIGKANALEVGCGSAYGTRLVQQEVSQITTIDLDEQHVKEVNERNEKFSCSQWDIVRNPFPGVYESAYSLDVIEHVQRAHEDRFIRNIITSLTDDGVLIIGQPSLESQPYASINSKRGHVNCYTGERLRAFMRKHFRNVFMFSMNDEVVHTGFQPMAHYLFAIGVR